MGSYIDSFKDVDVGSMPWFNEDPIDSNYIESFNLSNEDVAGLESGEDNEGDKWQLGKAMMQSAKDMIRQRHLFKAGVADLEPEMDPSTIDRIVLGGGVPDPGAAFSYGPEQAKIFRNIAQSPAFAEDRAFSSTTSFYEDVAGVLPQLGMQAFMSLSGGPAKGAEEMTRMIAGGSYEQLLDSDVEDKRAISFALLNGMAQAPLEQIGLGKLGKVFKVKGKVLQRLRQWVMGSTQEGLTEFAQKYPDEIITLFAKTPGEDASARIGQALDTIGSGKVFKEGLYEGAVGFVAGAAGSSPGLARMSQEEKNAALAEAEEKRQRQTIKDYLDQLSSEYDLMFGEPVTAEVGESAPVGEQVIDGEVDLGLPVQEERKKTQAEYDEEYRKEQIPVAGELRKDETENRTETKEEGKARRKREAKERKQGAIDETGMDVDEADKLIAESTSSIESRTQPGDERDAAFKKRLDAARRKALTLEPGDKLRSDGADADEDLTVHTVTVSTTGEVKIVLEHEGELFNTDTGTLIGGRFTRPDGTVGEEGPKTIIKSKEKRTETDKRENVERVLAQIVEDEVYDTKSVKELQGRLNELGTKQRDAAITTIEELAAIPKEEWTTEQVEQLKELSGSSVKLSKRSLPKEPSINIGLDVGTKKGGLTEAKAVKALKDIGIEVTSSKIVQSNTEQTLQGYLSRAPTKKELHDLSATLGQEAIAAHTGTEGMLEGPKKDNPNWGGVFNPEFYLDQDGRSFKELAETREKTTGHELKVMAQQVKDGKRPGVKTDKVKLSKGDIEGGVYTKEGRIAGVEAPVAAGLYRPAIRIGPKETGKIHTMRPGIEITHYQLMQQPGVADAVLDADVNELADGFIDVGSKEFFTRRQLADKIAKERPELMAKVGRGIDLMDLKIQEGAAETAALHQQGLIKWSKTQLGEAPSKADTEALNKRHKEVADVAKGLNDRAANAATTHVVKTQAELPQPVLEKAYTEDPYVDVRIDGTYYNGEVWLVSENLPTNKLVVAKWTHEQVGHKGLKEIFGNDLLYKQFLNDSYDAIRRTDTDRAFVDKIADEYELDQDNYNDRLDLVEEILANRVEGLKPTTKKELLKRFVEFLKRWLPKGLLGKNEQIQPEDIDLILEIAKEHIFKGGVSKYHKKIVKALKAREPKVKQKDLDKTKWPSFQYNDDQYMDWIREVMEKAPAARFWYESHAPYMKGLVGSDFDLLSIIIAWTSPRQRVASNMAIAVTQYAALLGKENNPKASITKHLLEKKFKVWMGGGDILSTLNSGTYKVEEFLRGLLGDQDATVMDLWMHRAFFGEPKGEIDPRRLDLFSPAQNAAGRHKLQELAKRATKELGSEADAYTPLQVQAIIWTHIQATKTGNEISKNEDFMTSMHKKSNMLGGKTPAEYLLSKFEPEVLAAGPLSELLGIEKLEMAPVSRLEKHRLWKLHEEGSSKAIETETIKENKTIGRAKQTGYTNKDGTSGFSINTDGDILDVYNKSKVPGVGIDMLVDAISKGGRRISASNDFQAEYYGKMFGFEEVGRTPGSIVMELPDNVLKIYRGGKDAGTIRKATARGHIGGFASNWVKSFADRDGSGKKDSDISDRQSDPAKGEEVHAGESGVVEDTTEGDGSSLIVLHYGSPGREEGLTGAPEGKYRGYSINDTAKRQEEGTKDWPYQQLLNAYSEGSQPESNVKSGNKQLYRIEIGDLKIYELDRDPNGYITEARTAYSNATDPFNKPNLTNVIAKIIKDNGYDGYVVDTRTGANYLLFGEHVPVEDTGSDIKFAKRVGDLKTVAFPISDLGITDNTKVTSIFEVAEAGPLAYKVEGGKATSRPGIRPQKTLKEVAPGQIKGLVKEAGTKAARIATDIYDKETEELKAGYRKALKEGKDQVAETLLKKVKLRDARKKELKARRDEISGIIADLKAARKKIPKLSDNIKEAVEGLLYGLDFTSPSEKTVRKLYYKFGDLNAIREELENNPEAEIDDDALAALSRLTATPIRDLSIGDMRSLHDSVLHLLHLNKKKNELKDGQRIRRLDKMRAEGISELKSRKDLQEAFPGTGRFDSLGKAMQSAKDIWGLLSNHWDYVIEKMAGANSVIHRVVYRDVKKGINKRDKVQQDAFKAFRAELISRGLINDKGVGLTLKNDKGKREKDLNAWLGEAVPTPHMPWAKVPRSTRMSLYMISQSPDNRRHLLAGGFTVRESENPNDAYNMTAQQLDDIVDTITDDERQFAMSSQGVFDSMWDETSDVFYEKNGYRPTKVSGVYWPIKVAPISLGTDQQAEDTVLDKIKGRGARPGMSKGHVKKRVNSKKPVVLVSFEKAFNRSVRDSAAYIGLELPMTEASRLLYGQNGMQAEIENRYGVKYFEAIDKGLRDIIGENKPMDDADKLFMRVKGRYATFALGIRPAVMLKQLLSYGLMQGYVDAEYLYTAPMRYALNPKAVKAQHRKYSPGYVERSEQGPGRDIADIFKSGAAKKMFGGKAKWFGLQGVKEKSMAGIKLFDITAVDMGMLGAVNMALDKFEKGKLTGKMKQALNIEDSDIPSTMEARMELAYEWADWVVERTQPMFSPEHRSALSRGGIAAQTFTMFTSFTNQALNLLKRQTRDAIDNPTAENIRKVGIVYTQFALNILGVMMIDDLWRALRGKEDDEEGYIDTIIDFMSGIAVLGYGIRDVAGAYKWARKGWGGGADIDAPIVRELEKLADVAVQVEKAMTADSDKKRNKALEKMVVQTTELVAGYGLGLPVGIPLQIYKATTKDD